MRSRELQPQCLIFQLLDNVFDTFFSWFFWCNANQSQTWSDRTQIKISSLKRETIAWHLFQSNDHQAYVCFSQSQAIAIWKLTTRQNSSEQGCSHRQPKLMTWEIQVINGLICKRYEWNGTHVSKQCYHLCCIAGRWEFEPSVGHCMKFEEFKTFNTGRFALLSNI